MNKRIILLAGGLAAGAVNGLFGAGGGLMLVPVLSRHPELGEKEIFPSSIFIILPICITSLLIGSGSAFPWHIAWPYMLGAVAGGVLAGFCGKRIPVKWLHRVLGIMVLYGGFRFLC